MDVDNDVKNRRHLDLKLGYSCNNNCIHCVITDQKKSAFIMRGHIDRSGEECKTELRLSHGRGCCAVIFTGGEPTLRRDFFELIRYARGLGFHIAIQTNGRAFCYKNMVDQLPVDNLLCVIALHGHEQDIHDSITRAKGSFGQTVRGIRNLVSTGHKVIGKTVISKRNMAYLKDIAEFFSSLGVTQFNFAFPHAQGNALKNFDVVVPKYTELKPYVKELIDFCEGHSLHCELEAIPLCVLPGEMKHSSDIQRQVPTELKQLNSRVMDWEDILPKLRAKGKKCHLCCYDSICDGPWNEYVDKFGSSELVPVIGKEPAYKGRVKKGNVINAISSGNDLCLD